MSGFLTRVTVTYGSTDTGDGTGTGICGCADTGCVNGMGTIIAIRNGATATMAGASIAAAGNGDTVRNATKNIEVGDGNTLFF